MKIKKLINDMKQHETNNLGFCNEEAIHIYNVKGQQAVKITNASRENFSAHAPVIIRAHQ